MNSTIEIIHAQVHQLRFADSTRAPLEPPLVMPDWGRSHAVQRFLRQHAGHFRAHACVPQSCLAGHAREGAPRNSHNDPSTGTASRRRCLRGTSMIRIEVDQVSCRRESA